LALQRIDKRRTTDDNPAAFGKLGLSKTFIGMHQGAHTLCEVGTAGCLIQVKAQMRDNG
jgi:hypothetical protein